MYRMKHSRWKKTGKVSEAVFRGNTSPYSFEVFQITASLKDVPAVFIISKRVVDRFGFGHHKIICIDQGESISAALKQHKKQKCIKLHEANVVCIRPEKDAANRNKIIEDLRSFRSTVCEIANPKR